jgi:hypothetical protein
MEQTECSETSAYKIQTPGNYPEENIEHLQYGESLKSRIVEVSVDGEELYSHSSGSSGLGARCLKFIIPRLRFSAAVQIILTDIPHDYSRTTLIRINWDDEPSEYAENPDN